MTTTPGDVTVSTHAEAIRRVHLHDVDRVELEATGPLTGEPIGVRFRATHMIERWDSTTGYRITVTGPEITSTGREHAKRVARTRVTNPDALPAALRHYPVGPIRLSGHAADEAASAASRTRSDALAQRSDTP